MATRDYGGDRDSGEKMKLVDEYVQGVPKKTLVSVQRLLEASKSELQIKVG